MDMPESSSNPLIAGAAIVAGLVILWLQGPRALVFLSARSVRVEAEEPADVVTVPGALERTWEALRALGFTLLGSHSEKPRLAPGALYYDAAHEASRVYASFFLGPKAAPRLQLFTPSAGGGVLTADFRRPARELPGRYLAGGIEGASAERLLKVHLRRVAELSAAPGFAATLEARVAAARAWYAGRGGAELRLSHTIALLWSIAALGLIASAALKL
jgi:hypothetical protein